jgi:hypothetical protein
MSCHKSDPDPAPAAAPKPVHEDRHEAVTAPAKLSLAVTAGAATSTWGPADFAKAPKMAGTATDGEARDTWSLRELVHANVSATARVTAVVNAAGKTPIDQAAWNDAAKVPILHTTKRGALKFRWADKDGTWGETVTKDVTGLEIAP